MGGRLLLSLLPLILLILLILPQAFACLLPFLMGLALAGIMERPVAALYRRGVPRWCAALLVLFIILLSLALVMSSLALFLGRYAVSLTDQLSTHLEAAGVDLSQALTNLSAASPEPFRSLLAQLEETLFPTGGAGAFRLPTPVTDFASDWVSHLPDWLFAAFICFLSAYYFSADLPALRRRAIELLPEDWRPLLSQAAQRGKGAGRDWLRTQGILMAVTFFILLVGFYLLGTGGVVVAFIVAVVDALPVLGAGIVLVPWSVIALLLGEPVQAMGLFLLFCATLALRNVAEPRLLGQRAGAHPLVILISIYAGFQFLGVLGMILFPLGAMFLSALFLPPKKEGPPGGPPH